MKVVIAPDSIKESLSAIEVANANEEGFQGIFPNADFVKVPMAVGGEWLVHALVNSLDGQIINKQITGPHGERLRDSLA